MELNFTSENIRAYLSGELTGDVLISFQKKLEEDVDFRRTVNYIKAVYISGQSKEEWEAIEDMDGLMKDKVVVEKGRKELQQMLDSSEPTAEVVPLFGRKGFLKIAATMLLLIIAGSVLYNYIRKPSSPELLSYSPTLYVPANEKTDTDRLRSSYEYAFQKFNSKNYQNVIDTTTNLIESYPFDVEYIPHLYNLKGMAYFNQGKDSMAIEALEQVGNFEIKPLVYYGAYYKAMAHIRLGEKGAAKESLLWIRKNAPANIVQEYDVKGWVDYLGE